MIDWLQTHLARNGRFTWWDLVGWAGNIVFFSRFIVQWYATEKKKQVVVPMSFWWLSLWGAMLLLLYAIFGQHSMVFTFSYAFTWIPYLRNIIIHKRHLDAQKTCPKCAAISPPSSNFCAACGTSIAAAENR